MNYISIQLFGKYLGFCKMLRDVLYESDQGTAVMPNAQPRAWDRAFYRCGFIVTLYLRLFYFS